MEAIIGGLLDCKVRAVVRAVCREVIEVSEARVEVSARDEGRDERMVGECSPHDVPRVVVVRARVLHQHMCSVTNSQLLFCQAKCSSSHAHRACPVQRPRRP